MPSDASLSYMEWLTTAVITALILTEVYILMSLALHRAFRKACVRHAWLAWIPVACAWPYLSVIRTSKWNLLWLLIPVANLIVSVKWQSRFFHAFGLNPRWSLMALLYLIPIVNIVVAALFIVLYCIIGFDELHEYRIPDEPAHQADDGVAG